MNVLLLIPSSIGVSDVSEVFPASMAATIQPIETFIVENVRTARRFLRQIGYNRDFDSVRFLVLNENTTAQERSTFLDTIAEGSIGLLSEAGVPCVADPGATIVAMAHRQGIPVIPLVGPSSILLALMASGLNGQNFAFNGYLPIEKSAREAKIKALETLVHKDNQTQIFIETPYRNTHLMESLCRVCDLRTALCIAKNITQGDAFICTRTIAQWRSSLPNVDKQNTVFLMGQFA
ncbi:S-adenosylmethionine-dependent methyltransferase [Bacteroidia bacterium]|nr:S-adenosylmethionine-dependent methyltransferase [Bacteroidia bacterium]